MFTQKLTMFRLSAQWDRRLTTCSRVDYPDFAKKEPAVDFPKTEKVDFPKTEVDFAKTEKKEDEVDNLIATDV